ncbi:MAG TPA: DNA-deoxyinosine glycosylase [Methylotenera sp.]|nr:DNA-deoxyinosine glycosylase [Methylotenera sp.]
MKKRLISFDPVAHYSAKILILGSMPGIQSLNARQYYAHKQNAFWKIMAELTGLNPDAPYTERLNTLIASGIALWDVLNSCEREGSLDNAIKLNSIRPNDFGSFFRNHSQLELICFNGSLAERCFMSHVLPTLNNSIPYVRLPSTSPAHATLSILEKVTAWREIIEPKLSYTTLDKSFIFSEKCDDSAVL